MGRVKDFRIKSEMYSEQFQCREMVTDVRTMGSFFCSHGPHGCTRKLWPRRTNFEYLHWNLYFIPGKTFEQASNAAKMLVQ